jgi:hypothetical protein
MHLATNSLARKELRHSPKYLHICKAELILGLIIYTGKVIKINSTGLCKITKHTKLVYKGSDENIMNYCTNSSPLTCIKLKIRSKAIKLGLD